ncbi:Hly-III family protein [Frigidibacter albus]|uniref:Hly-III family protein n=1 Tax=Frigidibacter albus TaxID=1465486 RepID=A0A6L8VE27_9RHOB|nr:hemolysin III family protein [Frigidibacter albus]MZQ88567.1 Hly-III family protein [Frigidibacter albus]NBE30624.1 Hly-III family protein [Frigidibacter albus]GGH49174.1 Hly-III family protein [Frigidibacter albus]
MTLNSSDLAGGARPRRAAFVRDGYSRAERLSDAVMHVSGLTAALMAVPVLVALTVVLRGDATAVVATSIYGVTLVAMILFSALYNMVPQGSWTRVLRRLDHSAIYLKIAGTYTPFTLLAGGQGYLLAGLWGAAVAGTGLKMVSPERFRWLALSLYLGMGWVGVVAGWGVFATVSPAVLMLIVIGGLIYTVGVAFYLYEGLPFHNTIWHGFVLVASVVFYAAVTLHVLVPAA